MSTRIAAAPSSSARAASAARKGSSRARMKTRPWRLTMVRLVSPTGIRIQPRPGTPGGYFSGRMMRDSSGSSSNASRWSHTWLPVVSPAMPMPNISSAVSRVMPAPPAMFSPLAITTSGAWSSRSRGRRRRTALRPGLPTMSPIKRMRIRSYELRALSRPEPSRLPGLSVMPPAGRAIAHRLVRRERPRLPTTQGTLHRSRRYRSSSRLLRVVDDALFADHHHLDLAGVLERLLDLADDVACHASRSQIVHILGLDDDADLAAGLDREALVDPVERVGDILERLEPFYITLERVAASSRPGAGNGVGSLHQESLDGLRLFLEVVSGDGMHHLGRLTEPFGDVGADESVGPLDLMRDALAEIVQQPGATRHVDVGAHLSGHHGAEVRDLDRVLQHVLTHAEAEVQAAKRLEEVGVEAVHAGLEGGTLALLLDDRLNLGSRLLHHLLDAGRVDTPILDELVQRLAGDLAPHRIEPGENHRLGGVVDDQIDAGGHLEGANVAPLAADDAALHLLAGQRYHRDRRFRHLVGGPALNGGGDDAASPLVRLLLGLPLDLADHAVRLLAHLDLDGAHQHLDRLVAGETGNPFQLEALLRDQLVDLEAVLFDLFLALIETALAFLQLVEPAVEVLLLLEDALLKLLYLSAALACILLGGGANSMRFLLCLQDHFLGLRLGIGEQALVLDAGCDFARCSPSAHDEVRNGAADEEAYDAYHNGSDRHFHCLTPS